MARGVTEAASARGDQRPARVLGSQRVGIEDVLAIAHGGIRIGLDPDPEYRKRLRRSQEVVERSRRDGRAVYGVTTGVGASLSNAIPAALQEQLPLHLVRFHGCGTGQPLGPVEAAAVVVVRLVSLARGHSGVREELLERLCDLVNQRLLPRIPEEGSVGASGDLTPLSYLAAALAGEREVLWRGGVRPAAEALAEAGLEALVLRPKESLALMNGTSVMTALACVAFERASHFARLAATLSAMAVDVTHGNPGHFDDRLFELKPHPGSCRVARWMREDLELDLASDRPAPARLQDRYSLRCAPHVIGVLVDALEFARRTLEIEINGVDDNPIIDPERGDVLHGGNFYGGHVCFVMDGLKAAVAAVADLLDRQLVLLCVPATSDGLPENLVAARGPEAVVHHGFKAMQISASALAAEAQKGTMPASAFSRSTESHNQDKVSMGTIAARDCLRVLELSESVAAIELLAVCQAVDLRGGSDVRRSRGVRDAVRKHVPMLVEDRRQDLDIARVLERYRAGELPVGAPDAP